MTRPFELWREDSDPAIPLEPSLAAWALSAFFLLLKRNAIVPFETGNLELYANEPQLLLILCGNARGGFVRFGWYGSNDVRVVLE